MRAGIGGVKQHAFSACRPTFRCIDEFYVEQVGIDV
jgi:hypothetical protein